MGLKWKQRTAGVFLVMALFWSHAAATYAQEKQDIPPEQLPIEERDQGDSFIENLGELPGDILTLPFTLLFKGLGHGAEFIDYNGVVLRVTDWLTSDDEKTKLRPLFTPPAGIGFTFKQNDLFKEGMKFRATASVGRKTRRWLYAGIRDETFFVPKLGFEVTATHKRLPDEDFFGIGNDSGSEFKTNYLHRENSAKFELISPRFGQSLFAAGFTYSVIDVLPGRDRDSVTLDSLFSPSELPGFFGADMWSFKIRFYRDTRPVTGHPTHGSEAFLTYEFSRQRGGNEFAFSKFNIDLYRYINLFYKRTLVLHLNTEITDAPGSKHIPFYRLAGLGGLSSLRGYRPVRFRDKDLILAAIEYRWPVHNMAIAYGFIEEGRVFSDVFEDFTLSDFKYSYGGGLRIRGRDAGLIAIFEIAKSKEQIRFNFGLNTELRRF